MKIEFGITSAPVSEPLTRGLLAATLDVFCYFCQLEVRGCQHVWDAGDGNLAVRVVAQWSAEAANVPDGRYLATRDALKRVLMSPADLALSHEPWTGWSASVAVCPVSAPTQVAGAAEPRTASWVDVNAILEAAAPPSGAELTLMGTSIARAGRIVGGLTDAGLLGEWRSLPSAFPSPWLLAWTRHDSVPNEPLQSITVCVMSMKPKGSR